MRFGAGWLSAGVAALLLTAGCKEGKLITEQQASAARTMPPAQAPVVQAPAVAPQAQGEQVIVGQVLTANDQEVLVSNRSEPEVRLQLKPGTVITVDGRQARAADIEEGSQVRAAFNSQSGEPTATRIEVMTSQRDTAPAAPESGESSSGSHEPGDQEAPFQPDSE